MKIESITIKGFRCFDDAGETIQLGNFACFVGPNASGKTAAMIALARMFGELSAQRQIIPSDFHLPPGASLKTKSPRTLMIECRLAFPELESMGPTEIAAIPETFNQMIVDDPGGMPYCRVRLDATWTDDGTPTGDVAQSMDWILTNSDDPKVIEAGKRRRVLPGDRGKIRVMYVPASRDPAQQIRSTTATSFGRLLGALAWADVEEDLKSNLAALQSQLSELPGVQTINSQVQTTWSEFYDGRVAREVVFQALEKDPASLIKLLVPTFQPGEDGRSMDINELSDGLRSLFSLSLSLGLFRVEELLRAKAAVSGFKPEIAEKMPVLTLFAVEEPENHLSPHYLGRVLAEFARISKDCRAQIILSSHSPSILGRVSPDDVRYFLGHEHSTRTKVKPIPLPTSRSDEEFKYVREAVRGFPELYFSRLVVLGEGPSEEIVLRRLFEASGTPLDTQFISIVPLGGRHVNHFWRLLHGLNIPFVTLLDLDREKDGAGWGRVQYVRDQLVQRYGAGHEALKFETDDGKSQSLEDPAYDKLGQNLDTNTVDMEHWLSFFTNEYGVFFSAPLDLDFAMLKAFPREYKGLAPKGGGPRIPLSSKAGYQEIITGRVKQILAADPSKAATSLGSTYTSAEKELFAWYKYTFVDGSKPVAHMRALIAIDDKSLTAKAPEPLKQIIAKALLLTIPTPGHDAADSS